MIRALVLLALPLLCGCATVEPNFPVKPVPFITEFKGAEGLTFNGEGELFIGANNAVWIASSEGKVRRIAEVHRHLGQARIGPRDILAADFGPTNAFQQGPNDDGIIWRITPDGNKTVFATGIGDPNALLKLPNGTWLATDDAVDKIYALKEGKAEVWTRAVPFPNGMALSRDHRTLYVAQIFSAIGPVVPDTAIWAIRIRDDGSAGPARIVTRTEQAPDGLVADRRGRIYIADNGAGKIRRFDPRSGASIVVAEGMPGVASLVFGEGKFDREALYATTTARGGGVIWKVRVGARGAKPFD